MRRLPLLIAMTAAMVTLLGLTAVAGATVIGSKHKFRYVQTTSSAAGGGAAFMGSTNCGSGFVALSGGTVASGLPGELRATGSLTTGTHQLWRSSAFNTGYGKNVSTVAMCRKASSNFGYVKQTKMLPAAPSVMSGQATCPGGKVIAGGGVSVQGPLSQVHLTASLPDSVKGAWQATLVNDGGASRQFTVYAVCMPANAGLTYTDVGTNLPAAPSGFDMDITCPTTGSIPLAGGARWGGTQSQVHIASSGPINSGGGVNTIPDYGWRIAAANMTGLTKHLSGELVCAPA